MIAQPLLVTSNEINLQRGHSLELVVWTWQKFHHLLRPRSGSSPQLACRRICAFGSSTYQQYRTAAGDADRGDQSVGHPGPRAAAGWPHGQALPGGSPGAGGALPNSNGELPK